MMGCSNILFLLIIIILIYLYSNNNTYRRSMLLHTDNKPTFKELTKAQLKTKIESQVPYFDYNRPCLGLRNEWEYVDTNKDNRFDGIRY